MLKRVCIFFLFSYFTLSCFANPVTSTVASAPTNKPVSQSVTSNQQPPAPQTLTQEVNGLLAAAQSNQQQLQTRLVQLNQQNSNLQQQLVLAQSQLTLLSRRVNDQSDQNHAFFFIAKSIN